MNWNPFIVGVDGSQESAQAAALGHYLAECAGSACRLIHAASDFSVAMSMPDTAGSVDVAALARQAAAAARRLIEQSLDEGIRQQHQIEVITGRPSIVLVEEGEKCSAEAIVMGGKHRGMLTRLVGSTIPHIVRRGAVPVLATDRTPTRIRRVLAAVDLSWATQPTIEAAHRWATMLGAELRVVHAAEPVPVVWGVPYPMEEEQFYRDTRSAIENAVGPLAASIGAEVIVRRGRAAAAITMEAQQWHADLLVLGSHGRGWVDRLLIGSTSERLLQVLPAPMLVIPVSRPAPGHAALNPPALSASA